ncbi:hypothetical protein [Subsaximicrobium wynnwilliamsii]|uniref:hypothetical protein n=1 Tax=Subsaximicrobium wynnwilliamsii TaxID=291179 RepID=UPI0016763C15|nr:hypothetical protein [Subsaximicrobium wynnwilliamsii]
MNADNADVTDLRGFMVAELLFNLRVSAKAASSGFQKKLNADDADLTDLRSFMVAETRF